MFKPKTYTNVLEHVENTAWRSAYGSWHFKPAGRSSRSHRGRQLKLFLRQRFVVVFLADDRTNADNIALIGEGDRTTCVQLQLPVDEEIKAHGSNEPCCTATSR